MNVLDKNPALAALLRERCTELAEATDAAAEGVFEAVEATLELLDGHGPYEGILAVPDPALIGPVNRLLIEVLLLAQHPVLVLASRAAYLDELQAILSLRGLPRGARELDSDEPLVLATYAALAPALSGGWESTRDVLALHVEEGIGPRVAWNLQQAARGGVCRVGTAQAAPHEVPASASVALGDPYEANGVFWTLGEAPPDWPFQVQRGPELRDLMERGRGIVVSHDHPADGRVLGVRWQDGSTVEQRAWRFIEGSDRFLLTGQVPRGREAFRVADWVAFTVGPTRRDLRVLERGLRGLSREDSPQIFVVGEDRLSVAIHERSITHRLGAGVLRRG